MDTQEIQVSRERESNDCVYCTCKARWVNVIDLLQYSSAGVIDLAI